MEDKGSTGRRRKFVPRVSSRRKPNLTPQRRDVSEAEEEAAEAQSLLRQFNENVTRRGPKADKKSSVQVAFGHGASSQTYIRSYGTSRDGNDSKSDSLDLNGSDDDGKICMNLASKEDGERDLKGSDDGKICLSLPSKEDGECSNDATDASTRVVKKKYREPWDYQKSYYPTVLPLRKPGSGDPELLDKAEFGEAATNAEYDENAIAPASELGLMAENEGKMFFFQFPCVLPAVKRLGSAKGKEKVGSSSSSMGIGASSKRCKLEELPEGYIGKMLVYKNGAVRLKLGDFTYDDLSSGRTIDSAKECEGLYYFETANVSPGVDCTSAQQVVVINTKEKHCCVLGELGKRAVVAPDVDSLLNSFIDLD